VHHYLQPVRWSNVAGVPITYVVNRKDRPIPTDSQEEMAQRLPQPADVVRIASGHLLPVTAPASFARILARAGAGIGDPESESLVADLE
jgi:pimeloyl-ACP methyl ester carboxylesterase